MRDFFVGLLIICELTAWLLQADWWQLSICNCCVLFGGSNPGKYVTYNIQRIGPVGQGSVGSIGSWLIS